MKHPRTCLPSFLYAKLSVVLISTHSVAGIVNTTGAIKEVRPPASVELGATTSDTEILLFAEKQLVELKADLAVDIVSPGNFPPLPEKGRLRAGTIVDSYFLHFDAASLGSSLQGTVTFSSEVLGIITGNAGTLQSSDFLGLASTTYPPTGLSFRGTIDGEADDSMVFSSDRRTLLWEPIVGASTDQMRVLTIANVQVPSDGDFNADGTVDSLDMDLLGKEIAAGTDIVVFDLNDDQLVDRTDRDIFLGGDLISSGNKINGDADFDGTVQFSDFVILSSYFGLKNRRWTQGDFDVNGDIDFPDFVILSGNFGRKAVASAAVPEPAGLRLAFLAIGAMAIQRKKQ